MSVDLQETLFYSVTSVLILTKHDEADRKSIYRKVWALTMFWMIYNSLSLLTVLLWFAIEPISLLYLPSSRLVDQTLFYSLVIPLLTLAPFTLLTLMGLRATLKKMKYWTIFPE